MNNQFNGNARFCEFCGAPLNNPRAGICLCCGELIPDFYSTNHRKNQQAQQAYCPPVYNNHMNVSLCYGGRRPFNKWVTFVLCLFFGLFGAHKFYERKIGMGILYIFTCGLCGIGWIIDLIIILCKPRYYYL